MAEHKISLLFLVYPMLVLYAHSEIFISEQPFIYNAINLTNTAELKDFFDLQTSIYVDNVYGAYQRFFFRLLSELPRGKRFSDIKKVIKKMDEFLEEENVERKLKFFENFSIELSDAFENIFEYEPNNVRLPASEFHEIFVSNGVEDLLSFANHRQMRAFVESTGNGIRIFLLHNRPLINKAKVALFKEIVDEFLRSTSIQNKYECLKLFLRRSEEFFL